MPNAGPLPGAIAALTAMHGTIPMVIATSSSRSHLYLKQKNNAVLFAFFDGVICGDDEGVKGKGKPDPAIFIAGAHALGVPPSACVAFEDSLAGILSAKAAGMFVVAVPDPRLSPLDVAACGPDLVVSSLTGLDVRALLWGSGGTVGGGADVAVRS